MAITGRFSELWLSAGTRLQRCIPESGSLASAIQESCLELTKRLFQSDRAWCLLGGLAFELRQAFAQFAILVEAFGFIADHCGYASDLIVR
jgi:hypothetical protein